MSKSVKKNEKDKNIFDKLNDSFLKENTIIFKKYKPIKIIGKGAFSKIYSTIRLEDKSVFAMKIEKKNLLRKSLETEAYFLFTLQGFGIPKLITFGQNKNYYILIETLLGKSLFDIFIRNEKSCDLVNMCLIALQLIERLEFIHSKNIIYRDVKPENFMIGIEHPDVINIVDFGLCKKYRSSKTGKHILPRDTKKFNGTLKYSSLNVIKGKEPSRRDDLISLGYVLIHLLKRNLPWNCIFKNLNRKTYLELIKSKETNDNGKLFENTPEELKEFFMYCQNLKFEEDPDYNYMKNFFQKILMKNNYDINKINFCWINPNDKNNRKLLLKNSARKSNSRIRILKGLENEHIKKIDMNSLDRINTYKISNIYEKDIIDNKNRFLSNDFGNIKLNKKNINRLNISYNNNTTQKEFNNNTNNKNNYIKIEEENKQKIRNKHYICIRNKISSIHKTNIPLINDNKIKTNEKNKHKNIYINNNNNVYVNFVNTRNPLVNNNINRRKISSRLFSSSPMSFNYFNDNQYISNITDFNNDKKLSLNPNLNMDIKYSSIFSLEKMNNNLYNSINKRFKNYKSKIKKEDNDNVNNDIVI